MFCGKCGKQTEEKIKFCPYCGYAVSVAQGKDQASQHNNNGQRYEDKHNFSQYLSKKKYKYQTVFNIVSLIVLIVIFIMVYFNATTNQYSSIHILLYYIRLPVLLSAYPSMRHISIENEVTKKLLRLTNGNCTPPYGG